MKESDPTHVLIVIGNSPLKVVILWFCYIALFFLIINFIYYLFVFLFKSVFTCYLYGCIYQFLESLLIMKEVRFEHLETKIDHLLSHNMTLSLG